MLNSTVNDLNFKNIQKSVLFERFLFHIKYILLLETLLRIVPGKTYTGEGSASSEELEKPVWRPKGRQLNKLRSMQITKIK